MKRLTSCIFIVSLFLSLFYSQSISAPLLPTLSHEEDDSSLKFQEDDMHKLLDLGMEECHENDGACLNKRMVAEAHLDYIYTQPHKPNANANANANALP